MHSPHTGASQRDWLAGTLLILILSAAAYLLLARSFGFYHDDWYLVYAGQVAGSAKFVDVFAGDRPFRAYFVGLMFDLFGLRAPLYSLVSYALRVAGALAMGWLLHQLWPRHSRLMALLTALFVIYPGWMEQPYAYDYQSHLLSFALEMFSLALTVRAWQATSGGRRAAFTGLAVLFQILSFLLMEYYIGLEGLRLALIVYLALFRSGQLAHSPRQRLLRAGLAWLPYLAGVAGFLLWRTLIFNNTRSATDIGGMLAGLLASPVNRGLWAAVRLAQDYVNVTLAAWFVPLYQLTSDLRLRDALLAVAVGALAAALTWAAWLWMRRTRSVQDDDEAGPPEADRSTARDLFWLGSFGVIFALIPVVLGERHVVFPDFSRFSLPGSPGALMALGGLLLALRREAVRGIVIAALAGLAVTMHVGNAVNAANDWQSMRDFWWQVSWRAPQIRPGTVLVGQYASAAITEDYLLWGPANLIYYPDPQPAGELTHTPLGAVVLRPDNAQAIQMGLSLPDRERRSLTSPQDLGQALVMSMPETGSCVHVFDSRAPEISQKEQERIALVAPFSRIERIDAGAPAHTPPVDLFGAEPAHEWCYYYQKASLARQQGDWQTVVNLGNEAIARQMHPLDWVEWFPFIQAYAYLGHYEQADRLYPILADIQYIRHQGCQLFTLDTYNNAAQFPQGQAYLRDRFCK